MTKIEWVVQGQDTDLTFYDCDELDSRAEAKKVLQDYTTHWPSQDFRLVRRVVTDTVVKRVRARE